MFKNFATGVLLLLLPLSLVAQGDPDAGKGKTATCTACHGAEGISMTPVWPNLAGQHAEYTIKQLHDFKDQNRTDPQMAPMAMTLSDQDIQDLGAYYAALPPPGGEASPETVADGEKIYRAGNNRTGLPACTACHGPNGKGNPAAVYPSLTGQHADYTAKALKDYKSETRNNDKNNIMRIIAGKMTNEEITAVANYIQGLH